MYTTETNGADGSYRGFLRQQVQMGRRTLLGAVVMTAINLILLLRGQAEYLLFSASVPYYLVWLGKGMDNYFAPIRPNNGVYTMTGLAAAALLLGVYMLLWLLSRKRGGRLWMAFALFCVDSAMLLAAALLLRQNIGTVLVDLLIHLVVLYQLAVGAKASRKLSMQLSEPRYTVVTDAL